MKAGRNVFDLLLHCLALSIQSGSQPGYTVLCYGGVGGLWSFCFGFVDTRVGVNGRCICSFLVFHECIAFLVIVVKYPHRTALLFTRITRERS